MKVVNISKLKKYVRNTYSPREDPETHTVNKEPAAKRASRELDSESSSSSDEESERVVRRRRGGLRKLPAIEKIKGPEKYRVGVTPAVRERKLPQVPRVTTPVFHEERHSTHSEKFSELPTSARSPPPRSRRSSGGSTLAFYTPRMESSRHGTVLSPHGSDCTLQPDRAGQEMDSLSTDEEVSDAYSPELERREVEPESGRYNLRGPEKRRKPERYGSNPNPVNFVREDTWNSLIDTLNTVIRQNL